MPSITIRVCCVIKFNITWLVYNWDIRDLEINIECVWHVDVRLVCRGKEFETLFEYVMRIDIHLFININIICIL